MTIQFSLGTFSSVPEGVDKSVKKFKDEILCNYTQCFPIRNASIRNSTENLGFFKKWVVKTLQLRNEKTVPNKIKKCHYSQKIG